MTVLITLTTAGADSGPFDLYSDVDGFTTPFESGITRNQLLAGYTSVLVPDAATDIKIQSTGDCTNSIDVVLLTIPTYCTPFIITVVETA